jgi:signal transduction histidine kinase
MNNDTMGMFLHELKTPLAVIRSHLESEVNNEQVPLEVRRKMVLDVEEIARLNHLIGEMKTVMSCDKKSLQLSFKQESLVELLVDVVELLEPLAHDKEQKLTFVVSQNIALFMNKEKLLQLFYNLIHNAIKYTQIGGEIEVSCRETKKGIEVIICDNGEGISPEDQGDIFEPFYRANKESKTPGTGLGLAVVKSILESHDGVVSLVSEVDKGSQFCIRF